MLPEMQRQRGRHSDANRSKGKRMLKQILSCLFESTITRTAIVSSICIAIVGGTVIAASRLDYVHIPIEMKFR